MKCRDCKYLFSNETMGDLSICVNGNSQNFGAYTGICCEDDCEDGVPDLCEAEKSQGDMQNCGS